MCAREALAEHERREGEAFVLEEFMNISWCHAVASCDFGDRQIAVAEMRADVGHDGSQPRGGDATSLRNRLAVARGADGCGNEIMHVADREPLQFRSGEWQSLGNHARIGNEQAQRLGYPLRYWWLSDAMDLQVSPDRLIVCVHHPSTTEDAGCDLYDALKEKGVYWGELDSAVVEEYVYLGKPLGSPGDLSDPYGRRIFPDTKTDG